MKRRVSGIVAGIALAAGAAMILPTTAGALTDPSAGLPVIYQVPVGPEAAQVIADTGAAAVAADLGYAVPHPDLSWILGTTARSLDELSTDIAYDNVACGAVTLRGDLRPDGDYVIVVRRSLDC